MCVRRDHTTPTRVATIPYSASIQTIPAMSYGKRDEEITLGPTPRRSKESLAFSPMTMGMDEPNDASDFLACEYYTQYPNRWCRIRCVPLPEYPLGESVLNFDVLLTAPPYANPWRNFSG